MHPTDASYQTCHLQKQAMEEPVAIVRSVVSAVSHHCVIMQQVEFMRTLVLFLVLLPFKSMSCHLIILKDWT